MKGEYQYKDQPLEIRMAKALIVELFAGKSEHKRKISKKVLDTHIERKGNPPKALKTDPVYLTLTQLRKESLATPLGKGIWAIVEEVEKNVLFLKEVWSPTSTQF